MLRRGVAGPLRQLGAAVDAVAAGDLTHALHSDRADEVGQLMRGVESMRQRLGGMMATVRQSVDSINTASSEIAHGNADLSQRTEHTANNLQQTASHVEQLSVTVRQSADAAAQADQLAASASTVARRGGAVVSQVVARTSAVTWMMCNTNGPYRFDNPQAVVVAGNRLWVLNTGGNSLTLMSTVTGSLIATIA